MSQLNISRRRLLKGTLLTAATIPAGGIAMVNVFQRDRTANVVAPS